MGYKNELFLKTVDENLCCSICQQIFQEPVSCKSGHTFCLLCIWEWLRTRNKCPLDNVALAEQDLVQNLAIRGIVENLEVSCHNDDQSDESMGPEPAKKPRGENGHSSDEQERCDWTGKLCDLQRHQLTCSFQLTYCPNSTYCKKIQKRKLEEHKKMCEYRTVACRLCGKSLAYNDRLKHKNEECPLELVSCTNKCETSYGTITKIQRCYLDEHVNSACDKAIIDCSFSGQGCSEQLLRKDLEKHLQDKMSSHMLLLAAENKLLKRELARVKEPNKTFVWSIEDYRNEANKYQTGSSFSSPMFWLCGYKWKLSLYPKGKVDERFLTLMLNRVDWGCKTQQPNQIICEALHAHVVCSHEVFQDPVSCKDGHTFCSACIEQWLKMSNTCPLDNAVIIDNKLVRNLIVGNIVDNLYVYCDPGSHENKIEMKRAKNEDADNTELSKCAWTGKLQSLAKHRATCPFQEVHCPNVNCNTTMQRRELENHDKACDFKIVLCDLCRNVLIRHALQGHRESECPEVLIACPNRCTFIEGHAVWVKRMDLVNHLADVCAETILDCPFKDQGCPVQVERQHMDQHVQDNMAAHMTLLAQQCSALSKQNSSLTEQNTTITQQCSALAKKCSSLTEQCSALTKQYSSLTSQYSYLTDRCSWLDQKNVELGRELETIKGKTMGFKGF